MGDTAVQLIEEAKQRASQASESLIRAYEHRIRHLEARIESLEGRPYVRDDRTKADELASLLKLANVGVIVAENLDDVMEQAEQMIRTAGG